VHRIAPLSVLIVGLVFAALFLLTPVRMFSGYSVSRTDVREIWTDCGHAVPIVVSGRFVDDRVRGLTAERCLKAARGRFLEAGLIALPFIAVGLVWLVRARPMKPLSTLGRTPWGDGP
jgi:hypothetical protein